MAYIDWSVKLSYCIFNTKTNKNGIKYGLAIDRDSGQFAVYKLCENYSSAAQKTGIVKTWRYIEKGMTKESAAKLYERRSA